MSDDFLRRARMALHDMQGRVEAGKLAMFQRTIEYAEAAEAERDKWIAAANAHQVKLLVLQSERDAIADGMNHTATIAHALEDGAIADNWAWIFEDILKDMNETLAIRARSNKEREGAE